MASFSISQNFAQYYDHKTNCFLDGIYIYLDTTVMTSNIYIILVFASIVFFLTIFKIWKHGRKRPNSFFDFDARYHYWRMTAFSFQF